MAILAASRPLEKCFARFCISRQQFFDWVIAWHSGRLDGFAGARVQKNAIVINATPMGLIQARYARIDYARTRRDCFFYDLIYAAQPTAFLRPAIALGRRTADGAGMLVNQGELAFELFNGVAPPPGVMRRALLARLGRDDHRP